MTNSKDMESGALPAEAELLTQYSLGILDKEDAQEAQKLVDNNQERDQELQSYDEANVALSTLAADLSNAQTNTSDSDGVSGQAFDHVNRLASELTRLLADAGSTNRFSPFLKEMVRLTEMSEAHAKRMLATIDGTQGWDPPKLEGTDIMHIDEAENPRRDGAEIGFVRVGPGATFPHHSHDGDEEFLVIQGACKDSSGRTYAAGDRVLNQAGSSHSFSTIGKRAFIFVVVSRGITI